MGKYLTELIGTFFLVFVIGTVISLYVAAGGSAQFGSDFAVVGFTQGLVSEPEYAEKRAELLRLL